MDASSPLPPLILIVDDEVDLLEIFKLKLTEAGFRVETAENGAQGIEKAKALVPNLILMDMKMPGMTGAEAVLKLKEDPLTRALKVVFLSSLGEVRPDLRGGDARAAQGIGAAGYIMKTDDLDSIVARVKSFTSSSL